MKLQGCKGAGHGEDLPRLVVVANHDKEKDVGDGFASAQGHHLLEHDGKDRMLDLHLVVHHPHAGKQRGQGGHVGQQQGELGREGFDGLVPWALGAGVRD